MRPWEAALPDIVQGLAYLAHERKANASPGTPGPVSYSSSTKLEEQSNCEHKGACDRESAGGRTRNGT